MGSTPPLPSFLAPNPVGLGRPVPRSGGLCQAFVGDLPWREQEAVGTLTPPSPHFLISEVGSVRSHTLLGFVRGKGIAWLTSGTTPDVAVGLGGPARLAMRKGP